MASLVPLRLFRNRQTPSAVVVMLIACFVLDATLLLALLIAK
jgi:hypothetical protein